MPRTTRHVAEVVDPVTGQQTTLTAGTAAELDQLVTDYLETAYPLPPEETEPPAAAESPHSHA